MVLDRRRLLLSTVGTASVETVLSTLRSAPAGTDDRNELDGATDTGGNDRGDGAADAETGSEPDSEPAAPVEFLDRETVRVTEPAADVIVSLFWWDEDGAVGTISEPVGSVDGERTISATEEFGTFAYGPVVTDVELFDDGTPTVPGIGDDRVSNPDADSHATSIRDEHDGLDDLGPLAFDD